MDILLCWGVVMCFISITALWLFINLVINHVSLCCSCRSCRRSSKNSTVKILLVLLEHSVNINSTNHDHDHSITWRWTGCCTDTGHRIWLATLTQWARPQRTKNNTSYSFNMLDTQEIFKTCHPPYFLGGIFPQTFHFV